MYTIYKFAVPYETFDAGDDLVALSVNIGQDGQTVTGEAYGGGYKGEIVTVPMYVLSLLANNLSASQLYDYITVDKLPKAHPLVKGTVVKANYPKKDNTIIYVGIAVGLLLGIALLKSKD